MLESIINSFDMVSRLSTSSALLSLSLTILRASALNLGLQDRASADYASVCTAIAKAIGSSKVFYQGEMPGLGSPTIILNVYAQARRHTLPITRTIYR